MKKIVHVSALSPLCVTRARAKQAVKKLMPYLSGNTVEIDFNDVAVVSLSFLDELVSNLTGPASEGKIVFRTHDKLIKNKLSMIADIRSCSIFCRDEKEVYKIAAHSDPMPQVTYEERHAELQAY